MRALVAALTLALPCSAYAVPRTGKLIKDLPKLEGEQQIRAIRALGHAGKRKAVEPLLAVFDIKMNPPAQSAAVIEALGDLGSDKAAAALVEAWDYLDSIKTEPGFTARLSVLRESLPVALAKAGGEEAEKRLLAGLAEPDDRMKERVARALGILGSKQAVEPLMELAVRADDVGQAACEALGMIKDKKALPALHQAASVAGPSQPAALYGLALLKDEVGEHGLKGILEPGADSDAVRILAAYYLTKLGDGEGLDYLVLMLGAQEAGLQLRAAEALGKAGNQRAVLPLVDAAEDDDPGLRLMAVRALGTLGGPRAIYHLHKKVQDANPGVRAAARMALEELGEVVD